MKAKKHTLGRVIISFLFLSFLLSTCNAKQKPDDSVSDDVSTDSVKPENTPSPSISPTYHYDYTTTLIEEQEYRTLMINGLRWMIDNLNYETSESWCYEDKEENCNLYGRLYTWEAARQACASVGWRLPTDEEWKALIAPYQTGEKPNEAAYEALIKGGKSGFEIKLGGFRYDYGDFDFKDWHGYFWTSTEKDEQLAWGIDLFKDYERLFRIALGKNYGYSCRCVKDN